MSSLHKLCLTPNRLLEATSNETSQVIKAPHPLWKPHQENQHPRDTQGMDHLVEVSRSLAHLFRYKRCVCTSDLILIPIYDIDHGFEMYRMFEPPRALLYDARLKAKGGSIIASVLCVATQGFSCIVFGLRFMSRGSPPRHRNTRG